MATASRVYGVEIRHKIPVTRSQSSVFFKHYTLMFNVKAADLTEVSVEEPVAEVAMRHESPGKFFVRVRNVRIILGVLWRSHVLNGGQFD